MNGQHLADEVIEVAQRVEAELPDAATRQRIAAVIERLNGPLRVAIAGRVKAGKSTLLNALVGERLAPTDAGECTRIVSWYRKGLGYQVSARMKDGSTRPLGFDRDGGALTIELGLVSEADIDSIEVQWPASTLDAMTLIDTPGLASINDEHSRRTREFLEAESDRPTDADAVVYLMRHAHSSDVAFLDAFMDRNVIAASPVNAVGVLSRSDEIGAGRLDAMESAARIAARYAGDPQLRGLCATVVPLAGLLAETGLTLREDEVASLRLLCKTDPAQLEQMLLSADQFCEMSASELTVELRRSLVDRLGVYGIRVAVEEVRSGRATTAAALGPLLVERSGLPVLKTLINRHFMPRARVLKARSALIALRSVAKSIAATHPEVAEQLDRDLERVEASAVEFAQVRAAHLLSAGEIAVDEPDRSDLQRLFLTTDPAEALGLPRGTSGPALQAAALEAIARWRNRGAHPLADLYLVEVCDTAVRSCEAIWQGAR